MTHSFVVDMAHVTVSYANHIALTDVNLTIPTGIRSVIIGPNGAGKSTLIKSILQLQKIQSGQIKLFNQTTNLKKIIQTQVAYIPQAESINSQFPATVFDVVLMGRYPYITNFLKRPSKVDKQLVEQALEIMQISDLKDRHITQLSGGQKKRVFIARAIVQEAELFILDEPLAAVDISTEKIIMDTLKQFQHEGKTSIVIHHDLNTVSNYFDYVVWLNKTVIGQGSVKDTFTTKLYQETYVQAPTLFQLGDN